MRRGWLAVLFIVMAFVIRPTADAQMMVPVVRADHIELLHGEIVPRCASVWVGAGASMTLAPGTYDCVEVAGTLTIGPGVVSVTTILVLPGGVLQVQDGAVIILRDVPLVPAADPLQWTHGIINFGRRVFTGTTRQPFAEIVGDVPAGATTLTLTSAPSGWQVGDALFLPDTRQIGAVRNAPIGRESPVVIAAISGPVVTLSKPTDFAHPAVRDPSGAVVLRPRVANLTRGILIRSENPTGVRGHIADVGVGATWDVTGTEHRDLGRTRNAPRGVTNQIGRYADHKHHVGSVPGSRTVGNSYTTTPGFSWAVALHGTHDALVQSNVCVGYDGGCFVTEDGYEIRNVFRGNVAAYAVARDNKEAQAQVDAGCPGCEGSGFWFRGLHNVFEGNEAWNNEVGFNLFSKRHIDGLVPATPGAPSDQPFNEDDAVPIRMRGNVTLGSDRTGLEFWGVEPFPTEDHVSAHNRSRQVWGAQLDGNHMHLVRPQLVAAGGLSTCIESSAAYLMTVTVEGGQMVGCALGISGGMAAESLVLRDVVMQNVRNLLFTSLDKPRAATFERVVHRQLGTRAKQFIVYGDGKVWQPGTPVGKFSYMDWQFQRGAKHEVIDWQGTGHDYVLVANQQKRSTAAFPTTVTGALTTKYFVPSEGLTMGQAWDQFGMAFGGDVVNDPDLLPLEGVSGGGGRLTLARPLGPPRAVVTLPNALAPAVVTTIVGQPSIEVFVMLTGYDGGPAWLEIDGAAPVEVTHLQDGDLRRVVTHAVAPGIHTIRAWRGSATQPSGPVLVSTYTVQ